MHHHAEGAAASGEREHGELFAAERVHLGRQLGVRQEGGQRPAAGSPGLGQHDVVVQATAQGVLQVGGRAVDDAGRGVVDGAVLHGAGDQLPLAGADHDLSHVDHLLQQHRDQGLERALGVLDGRDGAGEPEQELGPGGGLRQPGPRLGGAGLGEQSRVPLTNRGGQPVLPPLRTARVAHASSRWSLGGRVRDPRVINTRSGKLRPKG